MLCWCLGCWLVKQWCHMLYAFDLSAEQIFVAIVITTPAGIQLCSSMVGGMFVAAWYLILLAINLLFVLKFVDAENPLALWTITSGHIESSQAVVKSCFQITMSETPGQASCSYFSAMLCMYTDIIHSINLRSRAVKRRERDFGPKRY